MKPNHKRSLVILGAVALVAASVLTLPPIWHATLPLTTLVASDGGEARTIAPAGRPALTVFLHQNVKWCTCPGLGAAAQLADANLDSAFAVAHAAFLALTTEARRRPGQCLTISLEAGAGHHWPWQSPAYYAFAWHRRPDGTWVFYRYAVPPTDYRAAHERTPTWQHTT
jgi:hypothetical protein